LRRIADRRVKDRAVPLDRVESAVRARPVWGGRVHNLIVPGLAARVEDQAVADQAIRFGAVQSSRRIEDRGVGDLGFLLGRVKESVARVHRV
jgi:hypothetical protein